MDEKVESTEDDKSDKQKALFFQRLVAFIIDIIIITVVASIVSAPFIDSDKLTKLENQSIQLIQDYSSKKIDQETYMVQYTNLYYKISRNNGLVTIITILLYVLYYVVYQLYRNGQTIGKKLMKIRIISDTGELTMNQMIFRSFLSNFIIFNLINFIFLLFVKKDIYFYENTIISVIQYLLVIVSVIMIVSRKDGCAVHDKLVHTRVIKEN